MLVEILRGPAPKTGKVCVVSSGEPIPPEEAELIWERYKRVQHQGGRREGTEIGLAIVSTILKAHSLDYGVTSSEHANCFWFTFTEDTDRAEDHGISQAKVSID